MVAAAAGVAIRARRTAVPQEEVEVMILRPCPSCNLPVFFDAFGNTDHVCFNPDVDLALQPLVGARDVRMIIESTTNGIGGYFERQWRERGHAPATVFMPWWSNRPACIDDDGRCTNDTDGDGDCAGCHRWRRTPIT